MALLDALVDRARMVSKESTGLRVEGTTIQAEVRGGWFRCRLGMGGPEPEQVEAGRQRVEGEHELLFWTTDEDGDPVLLSAEDEIEVESNQPGVTGRWKLADEPLVIRKKLELLGAGYAHAKRVRKENC